jgi:hypothetical protein
MNRRWQEWPDRSLWKTCGGQPSLSRAVRDALVARQPTTVGQALRIHGLGRKTTRRLLALGPITESVGIQSGPRTLEKIREE